MEHFFHHLFLPHESNNHRAKVLHGDSLFVYILIFALFNFGIRTLHQKYPDVLGYATDINVEMLLSETNRERSLAGLSPLTYNILLSQAAAAKARDMFAQGYWAHTSPKGKTPWDFITSSGYQYTMAGENLAKNFSTSKGVVEAWMNSPTHRDNIIKPGYKDIGFAVVNGVLNGEETTLVVQMFGSKETPPEQPSQPIALLPQAASEKTLAGQAPQTVALPSLEKTSAILQTPIINIPTLTRDITLVFIGILLGVLVIDMITAYRRHMIRISGHTLAHICFFVAIAILIMSIRRGALL